MSDKPNTPSQAVLESARLLRELHLLFLQGKDQSKEADAIRDDMESPWYGMTPDEQERIGGLSEDLYALADNGPRFVAMSEQQIQAWKKELEDWKNRYLQGDIDGWLAFWRRPRPNNFPPPNGNPASVVHFFQARCWDKYGDYETAALFMKAAEKTDPQFSGLVLDLLHLAGNRAEERKYANRILNDPKSKPVFVYTAASYMFGQVNGMKSQRESLCNRLVPILKQAMEKEQRIPRAERDLPETEMYLLGSLGMCYELLGKDQEALSLYNRALIAHPSDHDLLLHRGVVLLYSRTDPAAYADFEKAVQLNSTRCLPFLLLAQREFNAGNYWKSYEYAKKGSDKHGTNELLSMAYQIIAMSLSMLDQHIDWVLENFKLAERLDPNNATIAQNRAIATARTEKKHTTETWKLDTPDKIDFLESPPYGRVGDHFSRQMESMIQVA